MSLLLNFVIGFVLGVTQIGGNIWRTIETHRGNVLTTTVSSVVISAFSFLSITLVVDKNITGYIGFSVGSTFIAAILALRYKQNPHIEEKRKA